MGVRFGGKVKGVKTGSPEWLLFLRRMLLLHYVLSPKGLSPLTFHMVGSSGLIRVALSKH
jgi:hypothetical protein